MNYRSKLAIDIETFSSVDLGKEGVYRYVESDDFEVILFAYKLDDSDVKVVDLLSGEEIPRDIVDKISDPTVLKTAYNAAFELECLSKYFGYDLDYRQWEDTMFRAAYCGYNTSLKNAAIMLGLPEDSQKDRAGTLLINKFSKPRKPTKNDKRTRVMPSDDPKAWEAFKEYNRQDVVTECAVREALERVEIPQTEIDGWNINNEMLRAGVRVDTDLVEAALELDAHEKKRLKNRLLEITGIENPKSNVKLREWVSGVVGEDVPSIAKSVRPKLTEKYSDYPEIIEVFNLLDEYNKTSLAKYKAFSRMTCSDDRIRGFLQFYGTKTGRWAGRGVQVQNLPRNYLKDLDSARLLLKERDYEGMTLLFGTDLSDTASQLIRTAFIPEEGKLFAVADYSAIEARVIAWLAGEKWRLDVFRTTGKIYEASASQMFGIPVERICDKSDPAHSLRAQGKVAELALGYQGAVGAIARMDFGGDIPEDKRPEIVRSWREKSPSIVKFWRDSEAAAVEAIKTGGEVRLSNGIVFKTEGDSLTITLLSGRKLYYPDARVEGSGFSYLRINQTTRKIERVEMYGGKIVENIVQAVARDCLAIALIRLKEAGYSPKFHVHDEVIVEVEDAKELDTIISIMCSPTKWNEGLPLSAEGFITPFYKKD